MTTLPLPTTARKRRLLGTSVAVGVLCSLVPIGLAANGAIGIQVVAAATGALMTTTGVALVGAVWGRWRQSDLLRLVGSFGFLLSCFGMVGMLTGVGIYH